ncbi:MAG: methylated-DNA--[protein]-cysteine S-methyltransferase [Pirellulaceae bacterium]|nr:methylated-DNA--[protein]-cysteine S-methyltransferase [Pirellulaceae bacterium]
MQLRFDKKVSPVGSMLLVTDDLDVLYSLDFEDFEPRMHKLLKRYYGDVQLRYGTIAPRIRESLDNYFDGDFTALDRLAVATGGTEFQSKVWSQLRSIPPGETLSYGRLADRVGRPTASRAVGLANGANPVAIVVPCHRVIGASGALTGYGGGLARKRWLLNHEQAIDQQHPSQLELFSETAN